MGRITLDQADKLNEGGGNFFKLNADESKQVRFLWDRWEEVGEKWCFGVHALTTVSPDGSRRFVTVDCPKTADESVHCKYCAGEITNSNGSKSGRVGRIVIPLYNLDDNKIQYWVRSKDWVIKTLKPVLDEVANLPSIANQTFKIKRTGSGLDTSYTPIPVMNASDSRTKASFGGVGDPYDLGLIRKYDDEVNQANQAQSNVQGQPAPQVQGNYSQPRRTTEVF